jgi:hypothetical protein
MVVALGIIPLVIMLPSFSPFSLNQAQGQISFPCPNGYQHNSLGLCVPIMSLNPTLQECPSGYIKSHSGICQPVMASPIFSNTTNQTQNQGSSLTQRQPVQNQTLSQSQMLPSAQQQQWVTYRDPSGTYAISYPSEWDSIPGRNGAVMFRAPPETFSDQYINAAVLVQTDRLPSQTNTLQAMTEDKLKSYSVTTPDDKLIESQATSLSGLPAHLVHVQFLSMGNFLDMWEMAKLMALEVWTVNGDTSYSILYVAPVEKFEQYLPIAQQMINSFQILG